MTSDIAYMQRAIRLARRGRFTTDPNPNVGCVIVKDKQIVGEGWHQRAGQAHAEVNALKQAGSEAKHATAYVTLEPCSHTGKTPPCADALIQAGIKRLVVAMQDPNPLVAGDGLKRCAAAGIDVESGVLEAEARRINPGFIKRMETGRPFVRVKLAMSLDGRTAMASGESQWITGEAARNDVQRLRAESSAILTGIGTVLADDPSMNVRLAPEMLSHGMALDQVRQPRRIVLDSRLQLPFTAKICQLDGECIVYTLKSVDKNSAKPCKIKRASEKDGRIDLQALMSELAKMEVNLVHVEAGSVLCGALLKDDLVDEIIIYMAPHLMGDQARGLFHLPWISEMQQRISLDVKEIRKVGDDIKLTAVPQRRPGHH
jgi:diaminohydroxyphosphoribosylaminopyrimidine deaminase / 5-amino-6-(5-phosphoribosylamino)uracil reductase